MSGYKECTAIVVAGGKGKRMGTKVSKQYLLLNDKPLLYYSLKALEDSFIQNIVLVVGKEDIDFCKKEIVQKYGFQKVITVTEGGNERYLSVYQGIKACTPCEYLFIHDGARPFITDTILQRGYEAVEQYKACVAAMPVKDTIKIADADGFAKETPNRSSVWMMQTPQIFSFSLIKEAYEKLILHEKNMQLDGIQITDDAMVVETFTKHKIKFIEGSYENIKITTPEDLEVANLFIKKI